MWNIPDDVAETAVLLLSELTTNAYRHAKVPPGREIRARCVERDGRLRLTVTDASDVLPVVRETGPKGIDTYELPQPSARSSLRDQGDSNGPFNSH
jgi:anti-sigma regulatory factor (Ser/Thr protein kinase)